MTAAPKQGTCPTCNHIHVARDVTVAGSRLVPGGAFTYWHSLSRAVFSTRDEAEADLCRIRAERAAS